jgi:hypothetical protein
MTGGAKKLHQAVLALLECGQIEEAAKRADMSVSTLQRLMCTQSFQSLYASARQQVFQVGLSKLCNLTGEAVAALQKDLTCRRPAIEIMAAAPILEHGARGIELMDIADRLARLESVMEAKP